MSMGMTYEEYWDGDCEKYKYYNRKHKLEQDEKNRELWLQGAYIYEALLDASPAFNPFSKTNVLPYRKEPLPITQDQADQIQENAEKEKMEDLRDKVEAFAERFNQRLTEEGGKELSG